MSASGRCIDITALFPGAGVSTVPSVVPTRTLHPARAHLVSAMCLTDAGTGTQRTLYFYEDVKAGMSHVCAPVYTLGIADIIVSSGLRRKC